MTQFWRVTTHADFALLGNIVEHLDDVAPESMTSWSLFDEGDIARLDLIFDVEPDLAEVRRFANIPDSMDLACDKMPDEDWVRLSLAGLKPVEGGRFTLFGAHDRDAVADGQIGIEIEAGPAFGTGHHGTTKGCLEALDKLDQSGFHPKTVLDLGTGTGLLAIAAAKIWSDCEILATDIDEESVIETVENTAKNGVKPRIEAVTADGFHHPVFEGAKFELIFANILAGPLITLAPEIAARLEAGGRIILSGLLEEQSDKVEAAYDAEGLSLIDKAILDGWATLVYASKG